MRLVIPAVLTAALSAASIALASAGEHTNVEIKDYAFQKPAITVTVGTTVTWTNHDDDPHTVTADDKSFDSKGLGNGDTWSYTFTKPGRYPYHCSAHPFMKGTVIVTGAMTQP
jgi:plastocyanin